MTMTTVMHVVGCKKSDTGSLYASEDVSARNLDSYEVVDLSLFHATSLFAIPFVLLTRRFVRLCTET